MIGILLILVIFTLFYISDYYKNWELHKTSRLFPGPLALPLLGNSLNFATDTHGIFKILEYYWQKYGRFYRVWNKGKLYVICNTYVDAEVLLNSTVHICKNESYNYLKDWIGNGLISNSDPVSWRKHRKIITPTFHFKILNDFLDIFNKNSKILCDILEEKTSSLNIHKYVKLAALDNICETAMGKNMNVQNDSESDYVKAVENITTVFILRCFKVWLMIDSLFKLTKYAKIHFKSLEILHGTTDMIIKEGREKYKGNIEKNIESEESHKNMAFLDLLLKSEEGCRLTNQELREEVGTFMFAGHDTISSGISFVIYNLAANQEIQEAVYKEQMNMFENKNTPPTHSDLKEMHYLERVIKETERLYPSVPFIARELNEELVLPGNYKLAKGTQIVLNIYAIHRDPKVWSNPTKFDPDNFLPEAVKTRNVFAYIPFSAGPRNCIGQKYAMLAMKCTLSMLVRKFKFLPSHRNDKPKLKAEIVLLSDNGINVCLEPR